MKLIDNWRAEIFRLWSMRVVVFWTMFWSALAGYDAAAMACLDPPRPITDNMHKAFISVSYNICVHGFCNSTMARRVNAGNFRGACDALLAWNRAGGRVIKGLDNRRRAERKLCLEGL